MGDRSRLRLRLKFLRSGDCIRPARLGLTGDRSAFRLRRSGGDRVLPGDWFGLRRSGDGLLKAGGSFDRLRRSIGDDAKPVGS